MKKVLLLINVLLLSALLANSQNISLSNANGPISNNQVIWENGDMFIPLAAFIYVTNHTATDMEVMVKKEELSVVPGSSNYFCWSQCYPSNVFVSLEPLVIPANSTNSTNFSGDYDAAGNIGISKIRYTFFKNHQPSDSACVEVWFNAGYVGVGEMLPASFGFSPAYPNPASGVVNFAYEFKASNEVSASVRLLNILGEVVNETLITENKGVLKIDVSQFNAGVYFYSLMVNGNAVVTRKLVIK